MKAGQYHYARLEPTQVAEVQGQAGYRTNLISSNTFMHFDLSLNTARAEALFSDLDVRRALYYAIDRDAIAEQRARIRKLERDQQYTAKKKRELDSELAEREAHLDAESEALAAQAEAAGGGAR